MRWLKRRAPLSTKAVDKSVEQGRAKRLKAAEERRFAGSAQKACIIGKSLKLLS
jgi:hypothetical protein